MHALFVSVNLPNGVIYVLRVVSDRWPGKSEIMQQILLPWNNRNMREKLELSGNFNTTGKLELIHAIWFLINTEVMLQKLSVND